MSSFKPNAIVTHANQLLRRAASITETSWLLGFLLGGLVGYASYKAVSLGPFQASLLCALLSSTITGFLGHARGSRLRGEAQQALCILQIEENTRRLMTMMNEREDIQLMVKLEAAAVQSRTGHAARTNIITAVSSES